MKPEEVVYDIIATITPELWWLFVQCLATVLATMLVYAILKNVVAYLFVRFDREISKNVKVKFDGEEAMICYINMRHLVVHKKSGTEVLIPITQVHKRNWEIMKNGLQ